MARHGVPTPRFATFTDEEAALRHVQACDFPLVIKASGLAAGKGVLLPADLDAAIEDVRMMFGGRFGDAGREVVIEERLEGREASLMVFSDGRIAVPMPVARDHKRLLDGGRGPNTGGMGALAPDPTFPVELVSAAMDRIIHPALFALRELEGTPYVGILYAGLMVDPALPVEHRDSVRVLEFNCRFGDPEAQVILPLLETDLVDIVEACLEGRLAQLTIDWRQCCAASVVIASAGYPAHVERGVPIAGLDRNGQLAEPIAGVHLLHAATARGDEDGTWVTAGGRVLTVTAVAPDLQGALVRAYAGAEHIRFEGMTFRRDIGRDTLEALAALAGFDDDDDPDDTLEDAPDDLRPTRSSAPAYRAAGVDLEAALRISDSVQAPVQSTWTPDVLSRAGAFAGLFDARRLLGMREPVLVATTDGAGTKTAIAAAFGALRGLGVDVVNHCINDLLVHGARPLFFLDYIASADLEPDEVADIVAGAAAACRAAGCVLLGGESAQMPGIYTHGSLDLAGTLVGVVERDGIVDGSRIEAGDCVLALPSSGLHTNGFSLARRALAALDWHVVRDDLEASIGETLLVPHRSYLPEVGCMLEAALGLRGIIHITGGGVIDNPPRIVPPHLALELDTGSWQVPPIFDLIAQHGRIDAHEMYRVFNMGLGMLLVLPEAACARALELAPCAVQVGRIVERHDAQAVLLR